MPKLDAIAPIVWARWGGTVLDALHEEALTLGTITRPVDWQSYSIAEMVFKTAKGSGLGHQERRNESGRTALVLCATRPTSVQTLERLLDLPA